MKVAVEVIVNGRRNRGLLDVTGELDSASPFIGQVVVGMIRAVLEPGEEEEGEVAHGAGVRVSVEEREKERERERDH